MKGPYYIDSNVFILPLLYNGIQEAEDANDILARIKSKETQAYTSTLTSYWVQYVTERLLGKT